MQNRMKERRIVMFAQFVYLWLERGFQEQAEIIDAVEAEPLQQLFLSRPGKLGALANIEAQAAFTELIGPLDARWSLDEAFSAFVALIAEYYPAISNPVRLDCMEFSRALRMNWEEVRRRHWDSRAEDERVGRTFEEALWQKHYCQIPHSWRQDPIRVGQVSAALKILCGGLLSREDRVDQRPPRGDQGIYLNPCVPSRVRILRAAKAIRRFVDHVRKVCSLHMDGYYELTFARKGIEELLEEAQLLNTSIWNPIPDSMVCSRAKEGKSFGGLAGHKVGGADGFPADLNDLIRRGIWAILKNDMDAKRIPAKSLEAFELVAEGFEDWIAFEDDPIPDSRNVTTFEKSRSNRLPDSAAMPPPANPNDLAFRATGLPICSTTRRNANPKDSEPSVEVDDFKKTVTAAVAKLGIDAKPVRVISEVRKRPRDVRIALRELEADGEYKGFSRPRPKRYG